MSGRWYLVGNEMLAHLKSPAGVWYYCVWRDGIFQTHYEATLDYLLDQIDERVRRADGGKWDVWRCQRRIGRRSVEAYFGIAAQGALQGATT